MTEEPGLFAGSRITHQLVRLLNRLAQDLEKAGPLTEAQVRQRIRAFCERVLDVLDEDGAESEDGDIGTGILGDLEQQSREIAADLRRVEELMKRRASG